MSFFGSDLSYIHDQGFSEFSRSVAAGFLDQLLSAGIGGGLIVDLGCGSGALAKELCDAGYDVLGIDQSSEMLRIAKQRAPKARFLVGSICSVSLPECRAVIALGEIFNYEFEPTGLTELSSLFHKVYDALQPGGLFVFDVATPARADGQSQRHFQGDGWAVLADYSYSPDKTQLLRHITTFCRAGRNYRRTEETHRLQLHRPDEIVALVRAIGFRVRARKSYAGVSLPEGIRAFMARKPRQQKR